MNTPVSDLKYRALSFDDADLIHVSDYVLMNPQFAVWTASSNSAVHHFGMGGLASHTREVVDLCLLNNEYFKNQKYKYIDPKLVFLAALFHDIGKLDDYVPADGNWDITEHTVWTTTYKKKTIYHITRSVILWHEAVKGTIFLDYEDEVTHAILSHHGRPEWKSAIVPQTKLAWLLHLCDSISARISDTIN